MNTNIFRSYRDFQLILWLWYEKKILSDKIVERIYREK